MSAEIAEAVFAAEAGAVAGPVQTDKGCNLFLIAERKTPSFEQEAPAIRLMLFEELVARLRSAAEIRYPPLN
jgi:hypothetical protein